MKSKDHHMLLRGKTWQFKIRLPQDIQKHYAGKSSKFIEESLKTSDTGDARRLRDQKLRRYQSLWTEIRIREQRRTHESGSSALDASSSDSLLIDLRDDTVGAENLISAYGDEIDRMAIRVASSSNPEDFEEAREEVISSGRGQQLWREIQITRGDMTPLAPLCWEWLETKRGKAAKTRTEYSRAIRLLLEKFEYLEQVEHRKVRSFLDDLLQINAKATVQKYTTAYKGIWEHQGWHEGIIMWSVRRMDSAVPEVNVTAIDDDAYLKIMNAINGTGKRRLWLAAKIAAYSGASRSGVCGVRLEGFETNKPSLYLPETKRAWRTRLVPCHPAIHEDVQEWVQNPLAATTVTNEFSDVKKELGYGRELVFHSFRHSVANKLENARISSREIKRLLGHRIGNITFDTYSSNGLEYEVLEDVINKISWPELN